MRLIAEVKSKGAKPCNHPDNASGRICHRNNEYSQREILLSEIQKCSSDQESNELCAVKATEVVVFVLADIGTFHKPEGQYYGNSPLK